MPIFHADSSGFALDRRISARFRIAIPVQVQMPSGTRYGQLCDISEGGAKILLDKPPSKGATVLLAWATHEEFCKVMWVTMETCGVQFERPISRAVVLATTGQDEGSPAEPVANHSNIPMGQKRTRPGLR